MSNDGQTHKIDYTDLTTNTFNLASWWPSIPVCISLLKHVGVLALTLDNLYTTSVPLLIKSSNMAIST